MSSISDILQQTLDLIGSEPTATSTTAAVPAFGTSGAPQQAPTASSVLLEERRKLKQRMDEINAADFSGVSSDSRPQAAPMSALMNQAASSSVDTPKYWKSKKNGNGAVSSNKKTIEKRNKGSDYNDRLANRLQSKESKLKLKNKLKGK